ncbi:uncharacterized protein DUF4439 [Halopolyspora algeriensis]|uniref:Uncharacterized protein DUF4439 n=1 Tax=Halopolyspora algeriensis TaxID=1500506 RepID=A0A368VHU3_9ACTN|nr:ferritin-like domain-containing protein [Halopolyspora algeriensis]RCW39765.1 uncharacterized protein DUF4439 [Halopolyspora algeriensis]TQM56420.1 uncharacterized protein DUF4439 [Halopolyspora algeriensis]
MSTLPLSEQASTALRRALGAEHAAVWVYGLAGAFVDEAQAESAVAEAASNHRRFRERTEQLLREAGVEPPVAQPAYSPPQPVTDRNSAIRLLITAESDCATGWRSVLETTKISRIRQHALDGLTTTATQATRWRITIGEQPAALPFPGRP